MPVGGVLLSLWRAVTLLRVIALAFCLFLVVRWHGIYAHPTVAYAAAAAMVATTAVVGWLAVRGRAHRWPVVGLDLALTVGLTLASIPAQTESQRFDSGMPTLTTVWAAGPVIEVAILAGWAGGTLAAAVQFAAALVVRAGYDGRTLTSGFLLVLVGAVTGYVARLVVRAEDDLAEAVAARAALAERERLARSVHDGVLQVLALVQRRGREAGWNDLAASAAEQDAALRALISGRADTPSGHADLSAALRSAGSERVTVSVPAEPVVLAARCTTEIAAAVHAALDNVVRHAGSRAHAWVLLDRLDDAVEVTVRDDGCGMASGRLAAAVDQGRLGVSRSIRGRVAELGGDVDIDSRRDGTTVRIRVPVGLA